jgi:dolichyl-phosphate beta-glucosyltransferase
LRTLSLVIPAFNEETRLPALLETLAGPADSVVAEAGFELVETLLVDDGSTDRTRQILAEASQPKLVPVLGYSQNRGKGAAVAEGCRRAQGDYVLLADVDLSTPLGELTKLSEAIRAGADMAIGSRAVAGAMVERGPAHRKLTGKAFASTVRLLTDLDVRDTQNGFKLLPTVVAKKLFAEQLCPGFAFDVELLMRAKMAGLQIAEVPVLYVHDERSRVQVGRASLQMLRDIIMLNRRLRPRRATESAVGGPRTWLGELPADDPD